MGAQRILKNFFSLSGGKILGDLATLVLFITLSRAFGEEGLGRYSYAMAIGGFCLIATDFGLFPYTVREISRLGLGASKRYGEIVIARSLVAVCVFLAVVVGVFVLPVQEATRSILLLICVSQVFFALADGFFAFFVAYERMEVAAAGDFAIRTLSATAGISVIFLGGDLVDVALALAATNLVGAVSAYVLTAASYSLRSPGISRHGVFLILRAALPFAVVPILRQASMRLDILIISAMLTTGMVGLYNAAYRVVFLLFPLFHLVSIAILPGASTLYKRSHAEFRDLVWRSLGVTALVAIPAATGVWLIAPELIALLFGPQFERSSDILKLLALQVVIVPNLSILSTALISCDREKQRVVSEAVGLILGIAAYCLLIPIAGLTGAAIASVFTQLVTALAMLWALRDLIGIPKIGSRVAIAALGSGAFAALFSSLPGLPIYVVVPGSIAIYAGLACCFREVREDELRSMRQFVAWRSRPAPAKEERSRRG